MALGCRMRTLAEALPAIRAAPAEAFPGVA